MRVCTAILCWGSRLFGVALLPLGFLESHALQPVDSYGLLFPHFFLRVSGSVELDFGSICCANLMHKARGAGACEYGLFSRFDTSLLSRPPGLAALTVASPSYPNLNARQTETTDSRCRRAPPVPLPKPGAG